MEHSKSLAQWTKITVAGGISGLIFLLSEDSTRDHFSMQAAKEDYRDK